MTAGQQAVTVLTVSYDGAPFHGFARQDGPETVQGRIEAALRTILRRDVHTMGAGRTDAGVHALGQVVSFPEAPGDPVPAEVLRSLNALAGEGIVVTGVRRGAPGFDARHSAVCREYRYRIVTGPVPPLFLAGRSWWVKGPLDLGAMRAGAALMLGEHDFRSFCVSSSAEGRRTVREIDTFEIAPSVEMGEHCIVLRIVGRSFLHSMVRIVAGTLVEVGKGRHDPAWVGEALAACDRSAAGPTAPPEALTLWHVTYPDEVWL
ncbi:MAG: tRNA pseudouridine(38-40) synthase TruA [Coriobacteriia bacterium]|nr:tRNA pseudouridine(38-40) synthase TruA [Coriobacteriia bacterium]